MPVSLPKNYSADDGVLLLLRTIAAADGGALLVSEEEFAALEHDGALPRAERRGFVRVDEGGEWTVGAVLAITPAGRSAVGLETEVPLARTGGLKATIDRFVRRYRPRAPG